MSIDKVTGLPTLDGIYDKMLDADVVVAIREALQGRGRLPITEAVIDVAQADRLSAADLEAIASSMDRSTLADARLEAGRQHLMDAIGAIKPTPLPESRSCEADETPVLG